MSNFENSPKSTAQDLAGLGLVKVAELGSSLRRLADLAMALESNKLTACLEEMTESHRTIKKIFQRLQDEQIQVSVTDLTVTQAADLLEMTPGNVRYHCVHGHFVGARKVGPRSWIIPLEGFETFKANHPADQVRRGPKPQEAEGSARRSYGRPNRNAAEPPKT